MRLRNISPTGDLSLPALGIVVEAGAEFDADDDLAASLLLQVDNFEPVDAAAHAALEDVVADWVNEVLAGNGGPEVPSGDSVGEPTADQAGGDDQQAGGEQADPSGDNAGDDDTHKES